MKILAFSSFTTSESAVQNELIHFLNGNAIALKIESRSKTVIDPLHTGFASVPGDENILRVSDI
jgi:hypothetical protein